MENEIFKAGVRPGGPTSHDEIKMLVCYILTKIQQPMSFAQLHEALLENSLVNYFELVQAVDGLVKSEHLAVSVPETAEAQQAEQYAITPLGRQAGQTFTDALPLSVREKAVAAADRLLRRQKRLAGVRIDICEQNGGFHMELAIPEQGGELVCFSLFLPTRAECELVRRRFLNDPVFIYQGVLALLTGNAEVLGGILPQKEQLF